MHKIGIISDTHNLLRKPVTDILCTCDAILHGGDISSPQVLDQLKAIAPLYAVRGNTDRGWADELPLSLSFELFGIKIFMVHNRKMIPDNTSGIDLIVFGHSHKYEQTEKNGQIWLNPGSCGRRRFSLPVTMAVVSIPDPDTVSARPDLTCPIPSGQFQALQILQPQSLRFQIMQIQFFPDGNNTGLNPARSQPPVSDMKYIVIRVMKETDKGKSVQNIAKSCHISEELASQICRLYLTHPGVTPDGILGKMGL